MTKASIEKKTFDCYQSGYCCSEAISKTITEHFGGKPAEIARAASAFCGGIGGSHEDLCGAFTGGVMAIGWIFGRTAPGQDNQVACDLSNDFRDAFKKQFSSTHCSELLNVLGEQVNGIKCKQMTARASGLLYELIRPLK